MVGRRSLRWYIGFAIKWAFVWAAPLLAVGVCTAFLGPRYGLISAGVQLLGLALVIGMVSLISKLTETGEKLMTKASAAPEATVALAAEREQSDTKPRNPQAFTGGS
jgi:Na+/phosphate symporter